MKKNTVKALYLITVFFIIKVYVIYFYDWSTLENLDLVKTIVDYLLIYLLVVPIVNKLEKISK